MEKYIILVSAGEQTFLLGSRGEYVTTLKGAMKFSDALEAKTYIDKHGMEKITLVRKVRS